MRALSPGIIGIAILMALFQGNKLNAQESDDKISLGLYYSYAGISDELGVSSGIGIDFQYILDYPFSLGIRTAWFFPVDHVVTDVNQRSEFRKRILASTLYGKMYLTNVGPVHLYGIGGMAHHWAISRGEMTVFVDLPTGENNTAQSLDTDEHDFVLMFGIGIEFVYHATFFIEPGVVMVQRGGPVLSAGLRVPL